MVRQPRLQFQASQSSAPQSTASSSTVVRGGGWDHRLYIIQKAGKAEYRPFQQARHDAGPTHRIGGYITGCCPEKDLPDHRDETRTWEGTSPSQTVQFRWELREAFERLRR
jgi:hypothetical protein